MNEMKRSGNNLIASVITKIKKYFRASNSKHINNRVIIIKKLKGES
jgi:hypothetical protein